MANWLGTTSSPSLLRNHLVRNAPCCSQKIEINDKADESPVTRADLEIETALRRAILERYPDHSIFGEEFGLTLGTGDDRRFLWVLDPIDGTLSFITGDRNNDAPF